MLLAIPHRDQSELLQGFSNTKEAFAAKMRQITVENELPLDFF